MSFIEIEKKVQQGNWDMRDLHSHAHYEIYFLYKGSRKFFLSNALYTLHSPCIVVIPPYTMHKTEGGAFERYNIDVMPEYLNEYQREVLDSRALDKVALDGQQSRAFEDILSALSQIDRRKKTGERETEALFAYFVYLLCHVDGEGARSLAVEGNDIPPVVLKVINYLDENIRERISLEELSKRFFVSKGTLIYNFKKYTGCSPMEFLLTLRLTKAKEQLVGSKKGMEQIAAECGFSSANYFSLIFKQKEKMSPTSYRKYQRSKI